MEGSMFSGRPMSWEGPCQGNVHVWGEGRASWRFSLFGGGGGGGVIAIREGSTLLKIIIYIYKPLSQGISIVFSYPYTYTIIV